ncbi:MAG: AAA family ATPase, partial [Trueperaceae bacterium]
MTSASTIRPRWIAPHVREALDDTPVVAIVGPRQAGKSTLVASIIADRSGWTSWTLDDLDVLERAHADPAALIAAAIGPVAIDEVQRAPHLLLAIKAAVDRDRRPGRFLLTGSADVFALPRYGDALTGRIEVAPLRPFSQGELGGVREDFAAWAFGGAAPSAPEP